MNSSFKKLINYKFPEPIHDITYFVKNKLRRFRIGDIFIILGVIGCYSIPIIIIKNIYLANKRMANPIKYRPWFFMVNIF